MRRALTVASVATLATCSCLGQATPASPAFEVASVKENKHDTRGFIGATPGGKAFKGFTATGARLRVLIELAYGIADRQLSGGPAWVEADQFDVDAKAEGPTSDQQIHLMLQTLLSDRFKLKLRREVKEERIYELVVEKDPPKLLLHAQDDGSPPLLRAGDKPGEIIFQNIPVSRLVRLLSGETGRFVLDKTGLQGSYDFKLEWARISSKPGQESSPDASGQSIFKAIRDQLGLKLEPRSGPVEHFTIEHVEKLSEGV